MTADADGPSTTAPPPADPEAVARAEAAKDAANAAFKARRYHEAVTGYSAAIAANPGSAVYFSNRAFAHAKLEEYGSAIADASKAIELDPTYVKAYYRRCARRACWLAARHSPPAACGRSHHRFATAGDVLAAAVAVAAPQRA
jgi:tetratricopeptide (TPR) repeat protein